MRSLRASFLLVSSVLVMAASCTRRPSAGASTVAASESDPTGQYSYTSTAGGQPVTGTITITRTGGGLRGMMSTSGMSRDIAFEQVQVNGNRIVMETTSPSGPVKVELTRSGEAIRGTWQMGAMGNVLQGRRLAK